MKTVKIQVKQQVFNSFPFKSAHEGLMNLDVEVESDSTGTDLDLEIKKFLNQYQNQPNFFGERFVIIGDYKII